MTDHPCDSGTPGGVYLCQTGESLSCGACCGLYNAWDPSLESLSVMLQARTERFQKTSRDYHSLIGFKEQVESMENQTRPYPEFHHCPYLGFVGDTLSRPGCLLHPLNTGNNGVDHRGLSEWGGLACASYFCPTCSGLPARFKKIIRLANPSWLLYGLVIPETEMLDTFFTLIEARLSHELDPSTLSTNPAFLEAIRSFFELKSVWPFRPKPFNRLGNYFFNDRLYPRIPVAYERLKATPSPMDAIFTALGSEFASKQDLELAESLVSQILHKAVSALTSNT